MGKALEQATSLAPNLEKQTPHRVMRELYGQFVRYAQMLIAAIPTYEERHNPIANVSGATMSTLSAICGAIDYKSVQSVAPLVSQSSPPTKPLSVTDRADAELVDTSSQICSDWISSSQQYDKDTAEWRAIDPNISAADWTPEQKEVYGRVSTIMTAHAEEMENLGRASGSSLMEDFAVLGAQYLRAYVIAIPKYTPADNYLSDVARYTGSALLWACRA
ncbi:hypothetical protein VST63_25250 [Mycolicibacterium sp. 050232]|uniref:hypothetical protein n=1 Tax=Mycolicibacterium sp. 050232 TaxID=3113982 RepID=UPI002E27DE59|nr:hypothetical protein [Mycolicibacterium sp. 050232]MED5815681.1 hypothetical protein [Mycolicibacterium sp. 050232]